MKTEGKTKGSKENHTENQFDLVLLELHSAFIEEPEVKTWIEKWNQPQAIALRKELGFERGKWLPLPGPEEPFLKFLHFESASKTLASDPTFLDSNFEIQFKPGDPLENIQAELNEAAEQGMQHPDHARFKFQAINSTLALATVHRWAKREGKSRSQFYRKIADLIEKQEVRTPKEDIELLGLLQCFETLVRKLERLPRKDELDEALNSRPTPEGPARTKFNRWLVQVGLDGLPPRQQQKRKQGPVRAQRR